MSEDAKKGRRKLIIDSVRRLFPAMDFASMSIAHVAKEAGLAKGTVFFYFKTKEELFLEYTREEIEKWDKGFSALLKRLRSIPKKKSFLPF